jgi:O-Antigen ligase
MNSSANSISVHPVRDAVFCVSLGIYLLATQTAMFRADETMASIEFGIKLLMPVWLLVTFRSYKPPAKVILVLCVYVALTIYLIAIGLVSEAPRLVLLNTAKFLYNALFLAILFVTLRRQNCSLKFLAVIPYLGTLFAIQTIIVFALVQSGHPPPSEPIVMVRYKDLRLKSFGLLGYGSSIQAEGKSFQVYRAQSFFMEPTRLASFLESAVILALGLYKVARRKSMLLCAGLSAVSLVLTFSMTGYIVSFSTAIVYLLTQYWRRVRGMAPFISAGTVVIAVAVIYGYINGATTFYQASEQALNVAFGHADTEVTGRAGFVRETIRLIQEHPYGIGVIGAEDSSILQGYAGAGDVIAPMAWLVFAGVPGLMLQLGIITTVLLIAVRRIRLGGIERYIGLAFVAAVLHHCVAGDWFDSRFFLLLAAVLMTDASYVSLGRGHAATRSLSQRYRLGPRCEMFTLPYSTRH